MLEYIISYNQVYITKHVLKSLHLGFISRENTNHYKVGGDYFISSSLIKLRTLCIYLIILHTYKDIVHPREYMSYNVQIIRLQN